MKYIITGSLGNISKPLAQKLIGAGHEVTIISSKAGHADEIKALGATPAIGSVEDRQFLENSFAGADAAYLMTPPNFVATDFYAYQQKVADNYIAAITKNNIRYVVQLSSIGAHMRKGAGPIDGLAYLEEELGKSEDVNAVFLRPSYFYNNLFAQVDLVKNAGIFGGNFGGEEKLVLTDTDDIADAAAEVLLKLSFTGQQVKYIATEERTTAEIATLLGNAIGKPGTPWIIFSEEQSLQGMLGAGIPQPMAEAYTQMGKSIREGLIQEDYWKNRPETLGKLKLEEFAGRFANAYRD